MKVEYNPKMPIIVQCIKTLYSLPDCGTGGNCHTVTDDDNIQDENLQFVIDECNRPENTSDDKELSELICKLLLQLSFEQRVVLFYMMSCFDLYGYDWDSFDKSVWNTLMEREVANQTLQEIIKQVIY